MKKVLLDTDIGSDIDDAVSLAYLLSHKECDLMGITTVSSETEKRAQLASAMCKAAGKNIPIYPGIENPLIICQKQTSAKQHESIGKWDYESEFPRFEAVEFLRRTIRENPNEITLLAIGPMTNIAVLFTVDPEIPHLLKELVLMCGIFTDDNRVECNAMYDPHAAFMVYNAPVKVHRSVGLDVTLKVVMTKNEVLKRFQADILKPVVDFAGVWFERFDTITFHDPLAAVTIFNDSICGFEKGNVEVELSKEGLCGCTRWNPDAQNGKHEAAFTVDADSFVKHYFKIVNGA